MSSCVCSGRFRPCGTRLTVVFEQVREYKFKYVRLLGAAVLVLEPHRPCGTR
ncbi:hypothetical protein [Paenibacillus sp. FSL H7-0331]|uniref:hypothetical protein n=1 Tax=Paenibacillus sp. FSL H7-0331 TaxID=1920421 RepID=UPI0015C3D5D1|nr:hypothetical protein [Paenibacillus sp. FSL H7-0331]